MTSENSAGVIFTRIFVFFCFFSLNEITISLTVKFKFELVSVQNSSSKTFLAYCINLIFKLVRTKTLKPFMLEFKISFSFFCIWTEEEEKKRFRGQWIPDDQFVMVWGEFLLVERGGGGGYREREEPDDEFFFLHHWQSTPISHSHLCEWFSNEKQKKKNFSIYIICRKMISGMRNIILMNFKMILQFQRQIYFELCFPKIDNCLLLPSK